MVERFGSCALYAYVHARTTQANFQAFRFCAVSSNIVFWFFSMWDRIFSNGLPILNSMQPLDGIFDERVDICKSLMLKRKIKNDC